MFAHNVLEHIVMSLCLWNISVVLVFPALAVVMAVAGTSGNNITTTTTATAAAAAAAAAAATANVVLPLLSLWLLQLLLAVVAPFADFLTEDFVIAAAICDVMPQVNFMISLLQDCYVAPAVHT